MRNCINTTGAKKRWYEGPLVVESGFDMRLLQYGCDANQIFGHPKC